MRADRITKTLLAIGLTVGVAAGCSAGVKDDAETVDSSTQSDAGDEETTTTEATTSESDSGADESEESNGALLLIMDASGSMNEADANGQPLLDGAKAALHGVVDALPDDSQVGLRVYGHRYPNTDKVNGCRDTELVQPVGRLDREAMGAAIDGYQAMGYTPIGLSLQEAVNDLPPEGPRSIVLVSDGEDTCAPPDPCEVAEQVRADGVELVIHTVGFALPDEASREQLQCIAEAGGGEFHDAANAAELATTLEDVSVRESRRYEPNGTVIEGAPIPRDAATGELETRYTDTVVGGETNYYRFEIEPGSEVTAELVIVGNPSYDGILCPNTSLVDRGDQSYSNAPFGGDDASETQIKNTEPVVVDEDEVWVRIEASGCSGGAGNPDHEYPVEIEVFAD